MAYPLVTGSSAWQYKAIPNMLGGVRYDKRSDQLEDNETTQLLNAVIRKGELVSDTGYVLFDQTFRGIPQRSYRFLKQSQEFESILVTTRTVYKYDPGSNEWQFLKGTVGTTTTATYGAGTTSIQVASGVGFTTGDWIGIELSDGSQHRTMCAVAGAIFLLLTALPVGKIIATGAAVIRAPVLSGTLDNWVDFTEVPSNDWLVFTNGVDVVKRYDGVDVVDVPGLPSGGNVVCNCVATFNAALWLLGTTEGGTYFPWRARRSDQGDPTEWVAGTAGKDDLLDNAQEIRAAKLLGPYLILYKSESVFRGQFVGSIDETYHFDCMVTTDGAMSPSCVTGDDTRHFLMGQKNVYTYQGDFALQPIGDQVFERIFGTEGNLNATFAHRSFVVPVIELNEVWIVYPSTVAESPDTILRYNHKHGSWYERRFNLPTDDPLTEANRATFVGFGLFLDVEIVAWEDLIGDWDAQVWSWDSQAVVADSYTILLMQETPEDDTTGRVALYDYYTVGDSGGPTTVIIDTKDFVTPDVELRFDMLEFFVQGTGISILYSIDEGSSWEYLQYQGQNSWDAPVLDKYRLFKQFKFGRIRFRFTTSQPSFIPRWFGFSYKVESL
jgi:hypothetical protein